jgi:hypothetical protein
MLKNPNQSKKIFFAASFLFISTTQAALAANNYSWSPQLLMTGVDKIHALGDYGQGITFGDVDTGITQQWVGFNAVTYNGKLLHNIDTANSGVCLNGVCRTGISPTAVNDLNGHGTFTASELVGGSPIDGFYSYAPAGKLISAQVLNANGSGYSNDVANGISFVANKGAQVINLSLGASGTATQQASFYQSLASAANAAAAKGVYIVFAGGNSAQAFSGGAVISGFSDAALQHMLIMGSTDANKKLSSFSNTPNTGYFLSTTGKRYNYSSMWLMADGENIWGASNYNSPQTGYNYVTMMSGTSMSTPQGAGAIGLLLAEWPILIKNGTAANILEATGTNIGSSSLYGSGFLNLSAAFQPIGNLSVKGVNGKSVVLNSSGTVLTTGALGNIASVTSILSNYTAFDTYARNFTVNLSSQVAGKPSTSQASATISAPKATNSTVKFADGSSLSFGSVANDDWAIGLDRSTRSTDAKNMFVSFTDSVGTTMAAGNGLPASASFAGALWGSENPVAGEVYSLGVSSSLTNLAQGGKFVAFGSQLSKKTRIAFSWSASANDTASGDWKQPTASSLSAGLITDVTKSWKAGLTLGLLNEQNGLLGTTYSGSSALSFGNSHKSVSMGVSSAFALGKKSDLLLDAAITRTDGANLSDGIISSVSPLYARSVGAALVQRDALKNGDNLSLSVRQPLRVFSGSASIATATVNGEGNPVITTQKASLVPTGKELDFSVGYAVPVDENISWNVSFDARKDINNVAGANDVGILVRTKLAF